jgi:hypothetical protein
VIAVRHLPIEICLLTLLGSVAADAQENWPQFRGPGSAGISAATGLPDRWSVTENIVWRTEIPGRGWSCPIVWGNRVIVTTVTSEGQEEQARKGIYPFIGDRSSEDGDTFVIQAGAEMKVLAKNSLGEMCMSSPALVPNALIMRTAQALYRIGKQRTSSDP